jgi:beta-lactamase class D
MVKHLEKLQYGNIKVDTATIDNFWLVGESKITPFEQIDFLKRLYQSELPISEKTEQLVKDIMVIERQGDYQLSGKTGWSINNDINNGWFVGYVQSNGNVHFFATNVEPKKGFDMSNFPAIRKEVTFEAFYLMKNDE